MKRAQLTTLQFITIALVAGLVLLVGTVAMARTISEVYSAKNCQASLAKADNLGRLQKIKDIVPPIECEVTRSEIKLSDVARKGSNHLVDRLLKEELATKMRKCWEMTGSGKLNPFRIGWSATDESFCLRCEEIEFAEDLRKQAEEQGYSLTNMDYFTMTKPLGKGTELYTQVVGELASGEMIEEAKKGENDEIINLKKKYTILWRFERIDTATDAEREEYDADIMILPNPTETQNAGMVESSAIGLGTVALGEDTDQVLMRQVWLVPLSMRNTVVKFPLEVEEDPEWKAFCGGVVN